MKEEKDLLTKLNRRDGMTVPEGYFADFAARMADSLPATPFEESKKVPNIHAPRTFWQRVRPYVYMAAMFAGVWCMLKMFTNLTTTADQYPQPSAVLAEALNNDSFADEYVFDDLNQWDMVDEMMDDGVAVSFVTYDAEPELIPAHTGAAEDDHKMQQL